MYIKQQQKDWVTCSKTFKIFIPRYIDALQFRGLSPGIQKGARRRMPEGVISLSACRKKIAFSIKNGEFWCIFLLYSVINLS